MSNDNNWWICNFKQLWQAMHDLIIMPGSAIVSKLPLCLTRFFFFWQTIPEETLLIIQKSKIISIVEFLKHVWSLICPNFSQRVYYLNPRYIRHQAKYSRNKLLLTRYQETAGQGIIGYLGTVWNSPIKEQDTIFILYSMYLWIFIS